MAIRIEVLPIGDVVRRVQASVPEPVTITVTASPSRGIEPTIEVAAAIAALGHTAVPHLSARLIRDEAHAEAILTELKAAGIGEVFVVGGDAETPVGDFTSGAQLLAVMERAGHDLRVGIPGYPEGHPLITDEELTAALHEKIPHADYVVTQMCFDAAAVHTWLGELRAQGATLPVYAGVPGPISPIKLLRVSAKVGVGESLRVLKSHRGGARLASPKPWDPTELVQELFNAPGAIAGLHVYSFNDVAAAYQWHTEGEFFMTSTAPTSLEIGRKAHLLPIEEIAEEMGLEVDLLEPYGRDVAKIDLSAIEKLAARPRAKYVVVSAITPTPLGEGKTTTTIGLGDGLRRIGKRSTIAIREASMGPTFGIKGGAAGGGHSQVVPMERLNLHLTGDIHAVTAAHNQLAAMLDAHLMHGNHLRIDPESITWRRAVDVNDRSLRDIVIGLGPRTNGVVRQTGFDITAASEVMATLALASSLHDLRARLGRIVVGFTYDGDPVTAEDLKAAGAMTVMLRDAIKPNLLQTLENTPALVHAGPFGNIATGNSSVVADLIGSHTGEYLITEAGFGADMGAERFFNIKCRVSGLTPDAAVVVATVRALKAHSGNYRIVAGRPLPPELLEPNPDDVRAGAANLRKQIQNIKVHGVTPVVAINAFSDDHEVDHQAIFDIAAEEGVRCALATHFSDGGAGATDLAQAVAEAAEEPVDFTFLYPDEAPLREKIEAIAREIYGADGVDYSPAANRALDQYEANGWTDLPICMAKTHLSLSSDPTLRGAPTGWRLPVREVRASVGAGFIYPVCGTMQTMPGLGSTPAAASMDIDDEGNIVGLF